MYKFVLTFLIFGFPYLTNAQVVGPVDEQFNSIRQNGVSTIAAYGDTVWISPTLNRNIGNADEWYTPDNADSVTESVGRVFSLDLASDTVVSGIGYSAPITGGSVHAGLGFYFSTDGGDSWRFSDFPLDANPPEECQNASNSYNPACDIAFEYGEETYYRVRNTVKEQSPPYSVKFEGNTVLASVWGSGLLRSNDFGETWEKLILPPNTITDFNPNNEYSWSSEFRGEFINRYDPRFDNNLLGFGLEIDSQNRVWFGSAGGVNVSENALTAPTDSISWQHIRFTNTPNGLLGDWVISIKEEPGTGRIWMTNRIANSPQKQGLVYTDDGGETFTQMLVGERINDVGFKDGYVFAAGNNGLFISSNGGNTWIKSPQIKSPNTFIKASAQFYSVAATTNRIWIGTDDGIASHECCQAGQQFNNWEISRVNYPLEGGNIHDPEGPSVEAYAYPNPFSETVYDVVRIKFEVKKQGSVTIRIFDFGMNLVRELESGSYSPGTYEAVWDGYDGKGRKVANGPYFYVIETDSEQINGKILVVD